MNRNVPLKWASGIALAILVVAGASWVAWSFGEAQGFLDGYGYGVEEGYTIGYADGQYGVSPDARRAHGNIGVGVRLWPW